MIASLSLDDRHLGWMLGLGDLAQDEVCHGYANACVCSHCMERVNAPLAPSPAPKQPWEITAA
jgi:hypothetical protein